ncbi:MAG: hypothetical protein MUO39_06425 [Steroidobacteraceae bacterium]|nr:hypothetical protein [Steroidobacteraceae bacterium]
MQRNRVVRGAGDYHSIGGSNALFPHLKKAIVLLAFVTSASQAAVVGEVIAAHNMFPGTYVVMSASNGGQFATVNCGLDLTHGGSPRYFLQALNTPILLPDLYYGNELVAADEDCTQSVMISDEPAMRFSSTPHWSPDGNQIAVYAERWDTGNPPPERGIYLADVTHDGMGRPIGAANFRLVIPSAGEILISWSGDGQRIAYVGSAPSSTGGSQADIFVYDLASGTSVNVTNTPGTNEDHPAYSPISDRIAFIRLVDVRGAYLYDIFTVPAWGGAETRVTTKKTTGSPTNYFPCFSPDGQYLSFASGSWVAPIKDFDIYRIKANGSGKATNLTSKRSGSFLYHVWRR